MQRSLRIPSVAAKSCTIEAQRTLKKPLDWFPKLVRVPDLLLRAQASPLTTREQVFDILSMPFLEQVKLRRKDVSRRSRRRKQGGSA